MYYHVRDILVQCTKFNTHKKKNTCTRKTLDYGYKYGSLLKYEYIEKYRHNNQNTSCGVYYYLYEKRKRKFELRNMAAHLMVVKRHFLYSNSRFNRVEGVFKQFSKPIYVHFSQLT